MPQETNLNVSPYFDDFQEPNIGGKDQGYYKVLFKPGYPIQARELTTLQSLIQNQIERFGDHVFKEGAKVIPGQTTYIGQYNAVEVNETFQGTNVSSYLSSLIGKRIRGQSSGVRAQIENYLSSSDSDRGNSTLYVSYISSGIADNETIEFSDGENLILEETVSLPNIILLENESFATTISSNSTSIGSAFKVSEGVYYLRGYFVSVPTQTIILDQYTNTPDYRIGFTILEEIVTSDVDEYLTDNAQGFNNYAAPGADRLKITAVLDKKLLDELNVDNFVEIAQIQGGTIRNVPNDTQYNLINDKFAKRTFEESGNYYVQRFDVTCEETLNNGIGNNGVYREGFTTYDGNTPSDDLLTYKISPGKAYVRGYEVEIQSPTFLDAPKPRTKKNTDNQSIQYVTGPTLKLNRVFGGPTIGIGNTYTVDLRSDRVGVTSSTAAGDLIGVARVFDYALESGSYNSSNLALNQWDISLYDIQSFTKVTLNEPVTLSVPTFVQGKASGATGYLYENVSNSESLNLYNVKGEFVDNESFTFNGIDKSQISIATTSFGITDVRSIRGVNSTGSVFSADCIPSDILLVGIASITAVNAGVSTVTIPNLNYVNSFSVGNYVKFTNTGNPIPNFAKVSEIQSDTQATKIKISGITTVAGICEGALPSSNISVTDFALIGTRLDPSSDNSLFTQLNHQNVSDVDLTESNIIVRKNSTVNIVSNATETITAGTDETFLPFDEERYSLVRSDGIIEPISAEKFERAADGSTIKFYNLSIASDTGANLISTRRKINVTSKIKRKNRVNTLVVSKSNLSSSGIGTTTRNDGLDYGTGLYPYGTRVQDTEISLNVPDIIRVYGIFESYTTSDPSAPRVVLSSISTPSTKNTELIIGEQIVGQSSGAIAVCAEKITGSDNEISFVSLNGLTFSVNEVVKFKESGYEAIVSSLNVTSKDITKSYEFDNGQRENYYDYGRLIRKEGVLSPTKKIKVYFENAFYDTEDTGDLTTANSYQLFDYTVEVPYYNGVRNTDIIDIRPRVSNYVVSSGARSPFEFNGRTFTQSGNSSTNILASDEDIVISYNYYLPRIDRIFVNKDGKFTVQQGVADDVPKAPNGIDDALEIAKITLPPYLYNTKKASINTFSYKRYQMSDIAKLETRIQNLESYTTLSLLETDTANLFVPDSNGLNRFKSGFFVDNFSSLATQEERIGIRNAIDPFKGELRPSHYTNSIDLLIGTKGTVGLGVTSNEDFASLRKEDLQGINVTKVGDVICLDYTEVEWLNQPYATRVENVTPYIISYWEGTIELNPSSDIWIDTVRIEPKTIQIEGDYLATLNQLSQTAGVDPQTGIGPVIWGSWTMLGFGNPRWVDARPASQGGSPESIATHTRFGGWGGTVGEGGTLLGPKKWIGGSGEAFNNGTIPTTGLYVQVVDAIRQRTGSQTIVKEVFETKSLGDAVVSVDLVPYMRSRNVQFTAKRFKPNSRVYAFFDKRDVSDLCFPKLVQITMQSGTFQVGETVEAYDTGNVSKIKFRVAKSNHKYGPFNNPSDVYTINPYNTNQTISANYSSTSTILNIDTFSLAVQSQSQYYGLIKTGYRLVGKTSGAVATVSAANLISDNVGTVIGSFFIPDPNTTSNPKFEVGLKTFKLTTIANNNPIPGEPLSSGEEKFLSSGTVQTIQEKIVSVRNARVETTTTTETETTEAFTGLYIDPLAQSFACDDTTGVFLTKVDAYFRSKDAQLPVTCQIRTVDLGTPTRTVLPFSEVVLEPEKVNLSEDGSVATSFVFESPVYLEGRQEYAIVLLSNSTEYTVWISRLGEVDIRTANGPESSQVIVSTQPTLGSLFKSQNASTWTPSQFEDLKFKLYRAEFVTSPGTINFYNPILDQGNAQIPRLTRNPINIISSKVRVGLGTTVQDAGLTFGNTVYQPSSEAYGTYVGAVGIATNLSVINAGIGYTPVSGGYTFNNVSLTTITGTGRNATANITITNGVAVAATINSGGTGYQIGDVLSVAQLGITSLGKNLRISVGGVNGINELILDQVQGTFATGTGVGNTIKYVNNSGNLVDLNSTVGGNVTIVDPVAIEDDGLHFRVLHRNHGMHSRLNYVTLSNIDSDSAPTKTTAIIASDFTGVLSIESSQTDFTTFEGVSVGATNPGYALVGNEIVKYTSASATTINIVARGIDGTTEEAHAIGTIVNKYELSGVSLLRINKTHRFQDATISNPIGLDYYSLKIDNTATGTVGDKVITNRSGSGVNNINPVLRFSDTKSDGGVEVRATQNMPFEVLTPIIQSFVPNQTSLTASVRTVSGQSISGSEISFVDKGYQSISLDNLNYFDSPRIIGSKVNEDNLLGLLPGNKSLNMILNLSTLDPRLSPIIDTNRISVITTTNRINKLVEDEDYPTDNRVNSLTRDQSGFLYVSKPIRLDTPATSIKLYVSANVNVYSDMRALYSIDVEENSDPVFNLFPGYSNINNLLEVVDPSLSDGTSDSFVSKDNSLVFESNTYKEYVFTANNLPSFKFFRVKLILTSTNQSYVPRVKDVRAIALA